MSNGNKCFIQHLKRIYWKGCVIYRSERFDTSYFLVQGWKILRTFLLPNILLRGMRMKVSFHSATEFGSWFLNKLSQIAFLDFVWEISSKIQISKFQVNYERNWRALPRFEWKFWSFDVIRKFFFHLSTYIHIHTYIYTINL